MSDKLMARIVPAVARGRAGGAADAELVGRYVRGQDHEAFAELVRRYGAMVLAVCRRVARNAADADDAFQATFLVLARRAGAIRPPAAVGPWLHGVAARTARDAARRAARRRVKESRVPPRDPPPEPPTADVRLVIDAELAGLPERFARVLVLCDMEDRPRSEVAALLRVPEGTVASRLARARERLAARLSRRGFGLAAGAVAGVLAESAHATLPPELVSPTARAALAFGLGDTSAASPAAVALASPTRSSWLTARVALLVTTGVAAGGWSVVTGSPGEPSNLRVAAAPAVAPRPAAERLAMLRERIIGSWQVDAGDRAGRPLSEWERSGFLFHFGPTGTLTVLRGQVRDQRAFTWTIDTTASPPVLLWSPPGGGADRTIRVPFEMRDNELVLAWDEPPSERGRRGQTMPVTVRVTLSKTPGPHGPPAAVAPSPSVVGARLAGGWESDPGLNTRLGRPATTQRLVFASDPRVLAELPDTFRPLFAGRTVHDAGHVTVGGAARLYLLVEHYGDARLVFFVPAGADVWACEESVTAALVPGTAEEHDLLFLTPAETAKSTPSGAFRRVLAGK